LTDRRRRALCGVLAILAVALGFPLLVAVRAAYFEMHSDFFAPRERVPAPPDLPLPGFRAAEFGSPSATLEGWYWPPTNGAVIVLLHGTGANRAQTLPEARAFADAGYGLLPFDWPGCGESTGRTTWGKGEREALVAALDFVQKMAGSSVRIGVYAFSMGTLTAIQVAAEDTRIGALVLAGAFGDPDLPLAYQFRRWGPLSAVPGIRIAHALGMDVDGRRPQDVIARIAPRPILIVAGTADEVIPPDNARALYAAARDPRSLRIVPGAGHGEYLAKGGQDYARALVRFFDDALVPRRAP
jgi:pimeloyl-ACP methyl ester carboxylesterase